VSSRRNPYASPDVRTREAKSQGYPARSVFKLKEIDVRMKLLRQGQRVLDLGAAPGSWTMYASERIGPQGKVLAIDLKPLLQEFGANVKALEGDALSLDNAVLAEWAPYDVVLSDMAPNTSGSKVRDQAQSFELFMKALDVATAFGKPGSSFVGKLFMSQDFVHAKSTLHARYETARVIRPEGTRQQSSEVFLVGKGLLASGPPSAGTAAG
jgi:23S rRNA (uridine2552-2'-O)-methyltransferase